MTERSIVIDLDGALGDTRPAWEAFLEHLARRFASIEPLEPGSLARDRTRAAAELDAWAASGVGDWRGQLTRFAEDHLPVYLRPDARPTAALRSLVAAGIEARVVSDAPQELVDVAAGHLGLTRLVASCRGGVPLDDREAACLSTPAALDALLGAS